MNDDYSHHRNLAACYQLAQSVLKIASVQAERVGRGCHLEAVVACCRKANARWAIILLSCTNGPRKHSFRLVGAPHLTF